MVRNSAWTGLGRKTMDFDSVKRHPVQDAVAICNLGWLNICESWIVIVGTSLYVWQDLFFCVFDR